MEVSPFNIKEIYLMPGTFICHLDYKNNREILLFRFNLQNLNNNSFY